MRFPLSILFLFTIATANAQTFGLNDKALLSRTSPLLNGLVGYWKLDEASGVRYDQSPSGNHLTSNNSVGSAGGKVGNAGTFVSASSQYLSIPSNSSLGVGNNSFSVAFWVKLTTLQTNYPGLVYKFGTAGNYEWGIFYSKDTTGIIFNVSTNGTTAPYYVSTAGPLATNTWYFIANWFDKATGTLNIKINNSGLVSSNLVSGPFAGNAAFTIGSSSTGAAPLNGVIDEVALWYRVLTAAEITQLYNSGNGVTFPRFRP